MIERRRLGMKQDVLAKLANVHRSYISQIENDADVKVSVDVVAALAEALGVTIPYLLGLTDNPLGLTDERSSSDLDDQIVITVEDPRDRALIQEIVELLARSSHEDRAYIAELVRRLIKPMRPRIIGGE